MNEVEQSFIEVMCEINQHRKRCDCLKRKIVISPFYGRGVLANGSELAGYVIAIAASPPSGMLVVQVIGKFAHSKLIVTGITHMRNTNGECKKIRHKDVSVRLKQSIHYKLWIVTENLLNDYIAKTDDHSHRQ
jgi:hypothetical protein